MPLGKTSWRILNFREVLIPFQGIVRGVPSPSPPPIPCMIIIVCTFVCFQNYLRVTKPCTNHAANSKESSRPRKRFFCATTGSVILDNLSISETIARNKNILVSVKWKFLSTEVSFFWSEKQKQFDYNNVPPTIPFCAHHNRP